MNARLEVDTPTGGLPTAFEEELLARDLVVRADGVHADSSSVICLPVAFASPCG
jgi:hypothetical protein